METLVLAIALVVEAIFTAYCIATKSEQQRIRGFIRMGALATFVVLTLLSVIQWSFRWYLLATLLLIWAALGVWTLTSRKAKKREYRAGRTLSRAVAALLLVGVAVTPALVFPQYRLPKMTGEHTLATVQLTYTDTGRVEAFANTGEYRKVSVEFWYPQIGRAHV